MRKIGFTGFFRKGKGEERKEEGMKGNTDKTNWE